jgi:small subunit ribosomal protein S16
VAARIRLARHGRRKRPFYRIVVTDSRKARDGRFIEVIGTYNPLHNPAKVQVNQAKTFQWIGEGAELSGTVERIFRRSGVLERYESFRSGEQLMDEEKKISVEIFGHDLDQHGSKRKGKRKVAAGPAEEPAEEAAVATEAPAEEAAEESAPESAEESAEAPAEETPEEAAPEPEKAEEPEKAKAAEEEEPKEPKE